MKENRKMKNEGRNEERTPAVIQNNDSCIQARVYNSCCAGLHNIRNSKTLNFVLMTDTG
jgi:hypothetical protein